MVLLIDNYDSFSYILFQYLSEITPTTVIKNDDELPPECLKNYKGVVLSPGPGIPETSGRLMEYTKMLIGKIPILGVCLGHQTLAQFFGGSLIKSKEIFHGRTSEIYHSGDGIFRNIPSPFVANRYHSFCVSDENFPKELEVTAKTKDGVIMGIRHRHLKNVNGVQFHPESILTEHGKTLLQNFVEEMNK